MFAEQTTLYFFLASIALALISVGAIIYLIKKARFIVQHADAKATTIIADAEFESERSIRNAKKQKADILKEAEDGVIPFQERIDRLKDADKELVSRLRESRVLIEDITDKCCKLASDIDLITEDDLLSNQSYQEDRKQVRNELKKLACNAIVGVSGVNSNVNIGKFVAISAKADMAGALLLTTVEMLSAKTNHSNGHQSLEKLFESIIATEALVKSIDSRATVSAKFKALLEDRLTIEINFKKAKQIAKEEQRELREQEREEKKARQEAEKIQKQAEKEEAIKQAAIADLEAKMAQQSESERAQFESELDKLKNELAEAHERFERAKSRAQETKQGHVYIVSNIGSFGEDVLKIGMTRRLEPMDRVKELGDASVPFSFDVHALIESEDAPNLESTLHRVFDHKRVNKVNRRKEYFNVDINEIETELSLLGIAALINKVASADEYYQSLKVSKGARNEKTFNADNAITEGGVDDASITV